MIDTKKFGAALKKAGFDFFSGVPCSYLKYLINYAINECDFVMAANEGDAAAHCSGAYLGGRLPVLMCQNSGLTNAVSPLTSLNHIFGIPLLGFVSLRGGEGHKDEPQHDLMGEITCGLLDLMKIKWEYLGAEDEDFGAKLEKSAECVKSGRSFFFVVKKGCFSKEELKKPGAEAGPRAAIFQKARGRNTGAPVVSDDGAPSLFGKTPSGVASYMAAEEGCRGVNAPPERREALSAIARAAGGEIALIAATGKTGRELHDIGDTPNNFYMVGSMGCAGPIALGIAIARPERGVIAIDGDAAVLMRMGAMATNGHYGPPNVLHILLDNHSHASTGGQFTVSAGVDFVSIAKACGYRRFFEVRGAERLAAAVEEWKKDRVLTFIRMEIGRAESVEPGRPSIGPREVRERFMKFLGAA